MNIQYGVGKVSGSRERAYSMGVNAYFGTRRTNMTHDIPNYGIVKYKFEVYYNGQTYCSSSKLSHIRKKLE